MPHDLRDGDLSVVALVTGAGSGIGRAVVLELVRGGMTVGVLDRDGEAAARVAGEAGPAATPMRADVAAAAEVAAAVDALAEREGRLDVLVNNAGITRDAPLVAMTDAQWDEVVRVNLLGAFHGTRAALRHMVRRRFGRIVSLSSIVGVHGEAAQANYAASKGGVIAFTKSVAKEVASRNITVNAIAPGLIATPLTDRMPEDVRTRIVGFIPAGRPGTPQEVARVVAFLASDDAAYITGQVIAVDGGLLM